MRTILTFLFLLNIGLAHGQDCQFKFDEYYSEIDQTCRPVYLVVDSMPEILKNGNILHFIQDNIFDIKSSCCPMYIWWGFVIEADGTLSNIRVCPQLEFCKGSADLENETKLFEKKLITKLKKRKVVPGFLKNEMVAIAYSGMIRFQCFDR